MAAGKDRLDVTADAHRLFQLGALGIGLGFQRCPWKWEAWATEISDSEAVQPSVST